MINDKTNLILDKAVTYASNDELKKGINCSLELYDLDFKTFKEWVELNFPDYREVHRDIYRKKLIELYTSYKLVNIGKNETYADLAGGRFTYVHKIDCKRKILHDLHLSDELKKQMKGVTEIIESSADNIPLPDRSIDCISSHHSFDHFQEDVDIKFVAEICRLLSNNGRCVIVPVLIGNRYLEVTNNKSFNKHFDQEAEQLLDETATLPGRELSGFFARIYNVEAFRRRILNNIDQDKFEVKILEITMDKNLTPFMDLPCNYMAAKINFPYRALYIRRK